MPHPSPLPWPAALHRIAQRANDTDRLNLFPSQNLEDLAAAGAMAWAIPPSRGGAGLDPAELHARYEQLAAVCLTTALIFTQRDAACAFLAAADPSPTASRLLREMAAGQSFITIGISQLTTSRQHLPPAVTAAPDPAGYLLHGAIPWVTSLHHCHRVIAGAVLPDRSQILLALDPLSPGVELAPALQLASLTASDTGEIRLHNVLVPHPDILRGPCENALAARNQSREFGLTTCILPLGLAAAAIDHAAALAAPRSAECIHAVNQLQQQHQQLRSTIYRIAAAAPEELKQHAPRLRAAANSLAARSSLAALELAKGHGFLAGETAQRRAREALFFFVWSSPPAIIEQTLATLACSPHSEF